MARRCPSKFGFREYVPWALCLVLASSCHSGQLSDQEPLRLLIGEANGIEDSGVRVKLHLAMQGNQRLVGYLENSLLGATWDTPILVVGAPTGNVESGLCYLIEGFLGAPGKLLSFQGQLHIRLLSCDPADNLFDGQVYRCSIFSGGCASDSRALLWTFTCESRGVSGDTR